MGISLIFDDKTTKENEMQELTLEYAKFLKDEIDFIFKSTGARHKEQIHELIDAHTEPTEKFYDCQASLNKMSMGILSQRCTREEVFDFIEKYVDHYPRLSITENRD